ncbi:PREDICTED: protein FAM179B-like [Nanorana parkeri]|uniref:protein FAM179B-like n=1 Tax=Nanorana parkeri TaxID=125878 RepID=UPI00085429A1|nr:PREDICTED: protein FAM179B-like [Nanorana parkeri]
MEVHVTRVAPFASNGDIAPLQTGSARRRSYTQESSYSDISSESSTRRTSSQVRPRSHGHKNLSVKTGHTQDHPYIPLSDSNLRWGVIPQELQSRLLDLKDYKSRTHAIEELKYLIQDFNFSSVSHSDVVGFISFLCTLLDDSNFTVVLVTLDVLNCFVLNLGQGVKEFLKPVIASTVKLLGDGKITVKQEYMKIYMRLMKVVGPYKVLTVLLENLKHKNSRIREEVVNICIVSLLTYPSEDFNLPFLACEIAPCLIDSKRRVRHAALEAFAVLAASMGPGKISLLKAVDEVELQENGEGLMNAVQARLARKTLPRISPQGLVEYALPFPSSAQIRGTYHLPGADTDWLLTGNQVQSGHYQSGDHSSRGIVPHIDPLARRMLSAGKGKNKFPWENQCPGVTDVFTGTHTTDQFDCLHQNGRYRKAVHSSAVQLGLRLKDQGQISDVTSVPKPKLRPARVPSASRNKDTGKKADSLQQGNLASEKPVRVIGQRMNYRNGPADAEEDTSKEITPVPTRHPQKPSRPIKGITGSVTNFQQINDNDATGLLSEDSVAVIGKGVFEIPPVACQSRSQASFSTTEDLSALKHSIEPPIGVYGRAVQQNNAPVESDVKVTMSKSARDKMRQKRENSLKELVDSKDPERRERLSQTDPGLARRDSWTPGSECLENVDISPPSLKRTSSVKKSSGIDGDPYRDRSSISRSSDDMDAGVPRELPRPNLSIIEVFKLLSDVDWEKKIEGLNLVRSLCIFHSDVIAERLHDLKIAITKEVKNLRSGVSRAAIVCLVDMFTHLKKNMDHELDNCVRVLLHKAGESITFIRDDVDRALEAMVQNVTPLRALAALLNGGLSHLNTAVRKCTAQHMCGLVERMGPGRVLSGIKDITDRAVPAIAKFAQDSSQETRFYGRKMLHYLMSHPDLDKMLEKHVQSKDLPSIRDLIKQIQIKGVGEIQDAPSARGRRSYHGSVGSLRASSVSQNAHNTLESTT